MFVRPHRERRRHAALSLVVISLLPLWIAWTAAHAVSDWPCCRWQQTLTPTDQKR